MQNYSTIHKKLKSQKYVNAVKHELTGYKQKTFICWNADRIFFSCNLSSAKIYFSSLSHDHFHLIFNFKDLV